MKKTSIYIVVILIFVGFWYLYNNTTSTLIPKTDYKNAENNTKTSVPDPANATFEFEDGDLTLKSGKNTEPIAPDSAIKLETSLSNTQALGDINDDGKDDSVVVLVQNGGGTGTFFYIAGVVSSPLAYKGTNAVFVGDRISPQSISINNGVITLSYLDRKSDEPFDAEPSVRTTKTYIYSSGEILERN
jgi:hypothetical protein